MRKITQFVLAGALLSVLATPVRADLSGPVGIWDVSAQVVVGGKIGAGRLRVAKPSYTYALMQFKGDGGFTTIPWPETPGQWTGKNKTYRTTFDLTAASAFKALPPFVSAMAQEYLKLVQGKYSQVSDFKTFTIKAYTDRGRITGKGMALKGFNRMSAAVTFVDPATGKEVSGTVRMVVAYAGQRASAPSTCCTGNDPAQNLADSAAFLRENAKLPGVTTTASGLQYKVLRESKAGGKSPTGQDSVTVNYRGMLPNGLRFDGGNDATVSLSGIIPGVAEGLQRMKEGSAASGDYDYYRLYIPPELAYGATGAGSIVKPNTALIFDVVLKKID